jgi:lipid A 4'-phosphatase
MNARIAWFTAAFLVLCGGLVLAPGIDLWASALFYRPGEGFFLSDWVVFRVIHGGLPYLVTGFVVLVAALLPATLIRRKPMLGLDSRAAVFLLLSLALGPGLTVNTIFKDHWGRARPTQIVAFGGDRKFSPAFVPSDQCARNCSFPAGDPSIGFDLVSLAFLARVPRRRRWGIAGALALGTGLGVVRLAQGGHFLSDIVASGFFVYGMSWLLYRLVIVHDGVAALIAAGRKPSLALKRFAWLSLAALLLFFACYALIDQPVARYFHDSDPVLQGIFRVVTRFGEGALYLVPLGLLVLWGLCARRTRLAWRSGFVFAAIALPGLLGDIAKPVFGRARPRLLIPDHIFGFTWSGAHADHWSFPSGHAITIVALATALYAIYPPLWPAYAAVALLVMASRIIIDAHYVSDVIAGAYMGFAAAWVLALAAKGKGIELALPSRKSAIAFEAVEQANLVTPHRAAAQGDRNVPDR